MVDKPIVAMKCYELREDDHRRDKIMNEIQMQMEHRGDEICPIIEAFEYQHCFWLVLPYMSGSFTDVIAVANQDLNYSEDVIKFICFKVLRGLAQLHQKDVIHRDIKSDNILFDGKGEIYLADFGHATCTTTEISETAGTLHWMAPELLEQKAYKEKVDIWAFGIFVYELTMVNPPFFDQREVLENVLFGETPGIDKKWSPEL